MMMKVCSAVARDRRGVSAVEYGILGAIVVMGVIAGVGGFMEKVAPLLQSLGNSVGTG
jgi:Flp pilus assembly pilin Flp